MRKRIVDKRAATSTIGSDVGWLDLAEIATVEVTSEDSRFPIESVFDASEPGWRASKAGEQEIRLVFDQPVSIRRIQLRFEEREVERTQEILLRWSGANGGASTEIIRQQWNFSPQGSTGEVEDYAMDLANVSVLELAICPDISRRECMASLAAFLLK